MKMNHKVEDAINDLTQGKFVLVYDVDGREEEVDLVCLADKVTPKHIYHLRHDGGGLICVAMHAVIAERLGLPYMADIYSNVLEKYSIFTKIAYDEVCPYGDKSAFSITINHVDTYTGVTDIDRALTIKEFGLLGAQIYRNGKIDEVYQKLFCLKFRAPGHTHLLIANKNLVLERLGHTELTVSLALMGRLSPVSVLCEMLDGETGKSLSLRKAEEYAKKHQLVIIQGKEIIEAYQEYSGRMNT